MTEKELQAAVLELCSRRGLLAYHGQDSRRDPRRSVSGFPDLVIAGPGGHLFAELKSEDGETTALQDWWAFVLIEAGARYYLWRPSDWAEIESVLFGLASRAPRPTP